MIATKNQHKFQEIQAILSRFPIELLGMQDFPHLPEPEESGKDYLENAIIKAKSASQLTHLPCIADDTGLEVDFLHGQPGVYSARFAGITGPERYHANNEKILRLLKDVPLEKRTARFTCVIVLVYADQVLLTCQGICPGRIIFDLRGQNGFGYDPLFEVDGFHQTFAEMSDEDKNKVSHRGRALIEFQRQFSLQKIIKNI